jgi:hypothetical protein
VVRWRVLWLAIALAGCADLTPRAYSKPAPLPAATPSALVELVGKTAPGQPVISGESSVQVVREYHAASGRSCKQYVVTDAKGSTGHLACRGEQGWLEVRPLILEGGSAAASATP